MMPSTWRPAAVFTLSAMAPVMNTDAWTPWATSQSMMSSASPTRPPMSKVSATIELVRGPWRIRLLGGGGAAVGTALGRGDTVGCTVLAGVGDGDGRGLGRD